MESHTRRDQYFVPGAACQGEGDNTFARPRVAGNRVVFVDCQNPNDGANRLTKTGDTQKQVTDRTIAFEP
jgi:hypothetical protein